MRDGHRNHAGWFAARAAGAVVTPVGGVGKVHGRRGNGDARRGRVSRARVSDRDAGHLTIRNLRDCERPGAGAIRDGDGWGRRVARSATGDGDLHDETKEDGDRRIRLSRRTGASANEGKLELPGPAEVRPTGRHAPLIGHDVRHLRHRMEFLNDKGKAQGQNGNGSHSSW